MRLSTCTGMAAAVGLLAGCATTPQPPSGIVRADLAVQRAEVGEAGQYARQELRLAQQKLASAREAASLGDQVTAQQLAEEALVSAQLALAEADSRRTEQMVEENLQGGQTLQQQATRREGMQ